MKSLKEMQVLIVDDEAGVRAVLSQVLEEDGYAVTEVASAEEALKLFEAKPFQLVISDIVMPGMFIDKIEKMGLIESMFNIVFEKICKDMEISKRIDKVSINTAAVKDPNLINEASKRFSRGI